jgi:hypothetical protein
MTDRLESALRNFPPHLARWLREQSWCPEEWWPHLLGAELGGREPHEVTDEGGD